MYSTYYSTAMDQPADLTTQMLTGVSENPHEYVLSLMLAAALLCFVPFILYRYRQRRRQLTVERGRR